MKKIIFVLLIFILCSSTVSGLDIWINPAMTSYTLPEGNVSANDDANWPAWYAFNHDGGSTQWGTNLMTSGWLQYKFLSPDIVLHSYNITSPNIPNRAPNTFKLMASNTGSFSGEQVYLDNRSGQTSWGVNEKRIYTFSNSNKYQYYRLQVDINDGGNIVSLAELELWGMAIPNASFISNVTTGYDLQAVQFNDTSSNNPTSWEWSFTNITGNNTPVIFDTIQNSSHIFGIGNYLISLNASNLVGYNNSIQTTFINVTKKPPIIPTGIINVTEFSIGSTYIHWQWNNNDSVLLYIDGYRVSSFEGNTSDFILSDLQPNEQHSIKVYNASGFGYLVSNTTDKSIDTINVNANGTIINEGSANIEKIIGIVSEYIWFILGIICLFLAARKVPLAPYLAFIFGLIGLVSAAVVPDGLYYALLNVILIIASILALHDDLT